MTTNKTNSTITSIKPIKSKKPTESTPKPQGILRRIFGELNLTWPTIVIFAIIMGIYTALMAMLVPDGNSFHDIAVTPEWWVLPAVFIIINCKKPLEAALKVFVFFLISQPLVYLIQVPFSHMGWGIFQYYPYWFKITLATLPAGFIGWYIKKDKWYSGLILSTMTALLAFTGINYIKTFADSFPNHLISVVYCFGITILFILVILKKWQPRLIATIITTIAAIVFVVLAMKLEPFETYRNSYITADDEFTEFTFGDNATVTYWSGEGKGDVEIIRSDDLGYTLKLNGEKGRNYYFTITDDSGTDYNFHYYYDRNQDTVILEPDD